MGAVTHRGRQGSAKVQRPTRPTVARVRVPPPPPDPAKAKAVKPPHPPLSEMEGTILRALLAGSLDFREAARITDDAGAASIALSRLELLGLAERDRETWKAITPAGPPRVAPDRSADPICRRCRKPLTQENWWPSYRKTRNRLCTSCSSKRSPSPTRIEGRAASAAGAATRRALRLLMGLRQIRNGLDREIAALEAALRAGSQDEAAEV